MGLHVRVLSNRYIDSVSLMTMSSMANDIEGVEEIIITMATEMNKEVMENVGLYNDEVDQANSSDLIITAKISSDEQAEQILDKVEDMLFAKPQVEDESTTQSYKTISSAVDHNEAANLALSPVNGQYTAREAFQALNKGINVMMFSDNVDIEIEKQLKI